MSITLFTQDVHLHDHVKGLIKVEIPIGAKIQTTSLHRNNFGISEKSYIRFLLLGDEKARPENRFFELHTPSYHNPIIMTNRKVISYYKSNGEIMVLIEKIEGKKPKIEITEEDKADIQKDLTQLQKEHKEQKEKELIEEYEKKFGKTALTAAGNHRSDFKAWIKTRDSE